MTRYIDAEKLLKWAKEFYPCEKQFPSAIINAPTADVKEVVRGEWLNFYGDYSTAECSECEECYEVSFDEEPCKEFFEAFKQSYNFCPNCGADMRKQEEK